MVVYTAYGLLTLTTALFGRFRPLGLTFFCTAATLIALRFETGFDWPIYKALFHELQECFSVLNLTAPGDLYNGEPGFLLLLGALSQFFPSYEWAQFALSALFLTSLWAVGRTFAKNGVYVFAAIALSYVTLTVGFSTVRQSLSIALFGFALVQYSKGRWVASVGLMVFAVLFQYSSAIYAGGFLVLLASQRLDRTKQAIPTFLVVLLPAVMATLALLWWAKNAVQNPSDVRLAYYLNALKDYQFTLWDLAHLLVFAAMAAHVILTPNDRRDRDQIMVSRLVLIFAAIAISATLVPILRERVSYELWILYALFLTFDRVLLRQLAVVCVTTLGLLYNAYAVLQHPNSLMFVPYQSVLYSIAVAERPYEQFMRDHLELSAPQGTGQQDPKPQAQREQSFCTTAS